MHDPVIILTPQERLAAAIKDIVFERAGHHARTLDELHNVLEKSAKLADLWVRRQSFTNGLWDAPTTAQGYADEARDVIVFVDSLEAPVTHLKQLGRTPKSVEVRRSGRATTAQSCAKKRKARRKRKTAKASRRRNR